MGRKKKVMRTPKAARRAARKRRSGVSERRKKEFTYRGLSVEELKALPMFAPDDDPDALSVEAIMPARARRSMSRGYAVGIENGGSNIEEEHFINRLRENPGKTIKTHCRSLYILPEMVGRTIGVHDGRAFKMDLKQDGTFLWEYSQGDQTQQVTGIWDVDDKGRSSAVK